MLDRLVWYVRPPRDVEAIADCSRQSFNRSVLPTKAATYESRFTIHRPTQMDSMTNMAAIQMIHTIQGPECRGGNEEQQIVQSRNACRRYKCSQLAAELGQKSLSLKLSQGSRGLCEGAGDKEARWCERAAIRHSGPLFSSLRLAHAHLRFRNQGKLPIWNL